MCMLAWATRGTFGASSSKGLFALTLGFKITDGIGTPDPNPNPNHLVNWRF